jgi:predicted patatin/cPLA2 family phospholipase
MNHFLHVFSCFWALFSVCQIDALTSHTRSLLKKKKSVPVIPVATDTSTFYQSVAKLGVEKVMVKGDTQSIPTSHPVIALMLQRMKSDSVPGARSPSDKAKIALAIEGGGMRGSVAAGATAALQFLGLADTIDVVYGSSAGSMVASYFLTRQSGGMNIYHDILPTAESEFINKKKLVWAALPSLKMNKRYDVFNLDFLLERVMSHIQPLDWDTFVANNKVQPLNIVATSIRSFQSVVMSYEGGHFHDMASLMKCIRSSMSVPGVTGGLLGLVSISTEDKTGVPKHPIHITERKKGQPYFLLDGRRGDDEDDMPERFASKKAIPADWDIEPLVDGLVSEPIPYRSAITDGATHVVALRTRPDPCPTLGKPVGVYEKFIARRFFKKHKEPLAMKYMMDLQHHYLYAEDVVRLNEAAKGPPEGVSINNNQVHILPIAPGMDCSEVQQLEMDRFALLEGMRDGARRAFQVFLPALRQMEGDVVSSWTGGEGEEKDLVTKDIEVLVDAIFPLHELKTSHTDFMESQTAQAGTLVG